MEHHMVTHAVNTKSIPREIRDFSLWLIIKVLRGVLYVLNKILLFIRSTFQSTPPKPEQGGGPFIFFIVFAKSAFAELVEFLPVVGTIFSFVVSTIVVYFAGKYLTLLPMYIVIPLALIPKKPAFGILGLSMFLSLFMVFLETFRKSRSPGPGEKGTRLGSEFGGPG